MSRLIIVGASVRAAAESALRAGFRPWCADLFADADLCAIVPDAVRCPVEQYPTCLLRILSTAPRAPWIYTGALENHPRLIQKMAAVRPLWGNGAAALRLARSPFEVARILRDADLDAPAISPAGADLSRDCRWLRKPLAGSAGQGIEFADTANADNSRHYYQQFIEGTPMSAVFVRAGPEVQLLGVTEQLIGVPWLNAPPFRYSGNIGPVALSTRLEQRLMRIGRAIGDGCGLLGLFGVDFVLDGDRPWVVEVNPRYTASVEVLELATGVSAIGAHSVAYGSSPRARVPPQEGPVCGKAILYAKDRITFPGLPPSEYPGARFADVPCQGEEIEAGWPILTLLAWAESIDACGIALLKHAEAMQSLLAP
jgi:predicted ATP-grasp superfamily ATP-dependent carboligase